VGLLDDAIREHLELKRRHGADPDEIARQEAEALGAPRRGEFAPSAEAQAEGEAAAPDAEAAVGDEPAAVQAPPEAAPAAEQPPEPAVPASDPSEAPGAVAAGEVLPPPDAEERPAPGPGYEEDPWLDEEPDEVPSTETLEHPAAAPPGEQGEDVLEETPEFLQETPEHDRLWFEQKPPRDFDWDK
jgi:hypothetical protein